MTDIVEKYLWIEKYRPKKIEDVVLTDEYRKLFTKFVDDKEIPHLLLYGPPGSGKTTMAQILISILTRDKGDVLFLNGSSQTGVDIMRNQVEEYLKIPAFGIGTKIKIVFIDEADYLSQNAQASLRGMTERYHEVGRFIFTANYISKFIDPLISRCQTFEFKKLPKDYLQNFCKDILNKENIKFDDVSVDKVITTFYPDVRRIVGILQSRTTEGELIIKTEDITSKEKLFRSYFTDVIVGVNNSDNNLIGVAVQKMLKIFEETELDYVSLYQEMFDDTNIPAWAKIVINKYSNNHVNAMIPAMNVMAMVYESITAGKQLRNLKR